MVEVQSPNHTSPKPGANRTRATSMVVPMAIGSPTASEMRRRRRRHSRLMSNASSVMSAAAAGIPASDKHKISNSEALIHMVKATIGGGFLAMPDAFHNAGVVIGVVGTVFLGLAVLNMMSSIVRSSQALRSGKYAAMIMAERNDKNGNGTNGQVDDDDDFSKFSRNQRKSKELILEPMDYPDTVAAVFKYGARGRFAPWSSFARNFTSVSLVTTYYGVNIIYVCIVAGTFKQLIDQYTSEAADDMWYKSLHGLSIRWYPALAAILIVPVGMVRLIKYLVPFSVAANVCMLAGTGAVFYFIFIGDDQQIPLALEDQAKMVVWPPTRWSLFAGSALCSLEGVGMLLHIENAMSRPLELAGPPSFTLHQAMVVIVILNSVLGLCGYMKYGDLSEGSISLNLPRNNRLSELIKVMIALGILLTYGLQLTVTADLAWQGLRKRLSNTPAGESAADEEDEEECSAKMTAYYYAMRFTLILGTIIVATAVPDIGPLVSLVGSIGFSVLGLIVPVAMETVWYYYPKDNEVDDDDDGDGDVEDRGDDDHEHPGSRWDSPAAAVNGSSGVTTVSATVESIAVPVATDKKKKTSTSHCRTFRRVVRHIKNVVILMLAICALVGGAFYNVRDIINQALSDGSSVNPVV